MTPNESSTPLLRVATYNVHGCVGTDGQRSENRIAEVIASLEVDVIGLQELDLGRARSAKVDQARLIAHALGWHALFQPAMQHGDEQYGDAILSRHPLRLRQALALPGCGSWYCREMRVAIWAETESVLGPVQIVNTHFGLGRAERFAQGQFLLDQLGAVPATEPLVLLGDFNSITGSRTHRLLAGALREVRATLGTVLPYRTFPTRLPAVAIDHIFSNPALQPVSLAVPRPPLARFASDHFPLAATFAPGLSGTGPRA